jgi:hypothetical protein
MKDTNEAKKHGIAIVLALIAVAFGVVVFVKLGELS